MSKPTIKMRYKYDQFSETEQDVDQDAEAKVNVDYICDNFNFEQAISLRRGRLEGQGLIADGRTTFSGSAFAQGVSVGSLFIGRLAAQAAIENGRGTVTASLAGRRGSQFDLQLNADVQPNRYAVAARGEYAGRAIRMPRRAVLLRQGDGGWQLQRTQVSFGSGVLLAEGEFGGGRTALDLQLAKMPLALLDIGLCFAVDLVPGYSGDQLWVPVSAQSVVVFSPAGPTDQLAEVAVVAEVSPGSSEAAAPRRYG